MWCQQLSCLISFTLVDLFEKIVVCRFTGLPFCSFEHVEHDFLINSLYHTSPTFSIDRLLSPYTCMNVLWCFLCFFVCLCMSLFALTRLFFHQSNTLLFSLYFLVDSFSFQARKDKVTRSSRVMLPIYICQSHLRWGCWIEGVEETTLFKFFDFDTKWG